MNPTFRLIFDIRLKKTFLCHIFFVIHFVEISILHAEFQLIFEQKLISVINKRRIDKITQE